MTSNVLAVLDVISKNWSKDEIVRYLYVKLSPFFQRDLDYFMGMMISV